ncbi:MAG: hypothetical protein AABZ47_17930, partial [Planctomycetota bacterium]
MRWKVKYLFGLGTCLWAVSFVPDAARGAIIMGTAFTYQGQLKNDGVPLNGAADFRFTLWNDAVGGVPIGVSQFRNNHAVTAGLFAVELDFGQSAFDGSSRWLEIAVRVPPGAGDYTPINPRQPMSPTPYALFALSAASLQLPFAGSANSPSNAVDVTNAGIGKAAAFATTSGSNHVATVEGLQGGLGQCGHFHISNPANTEEAMAASSVGSGAAVLGFATGSGPAGEFQITSASNASNALIASTSGTGRVASFTSNNTASNSPTVYAEQKGLGRGGHFRIT